MREGRVDMALDDFKKAVKADPKNPYFQKGLGKAYAAKRKWGDAIEAFRKALELNPYYVDVRNDLGTALILGGQPRGGARRSSSPLFGDPTNPTPEISARNLGQAYLEEKNYARGRELVPHQPQPEQGLHRRLPRRSPTRSWAIGRPEEALVQLERG